MTNKEIEKRFLFDLEMGLFNRSSIYPYKNMILFTASEENISKFGIIKLEFLLRNYLNYKYMENFTLLTFSNQVIAINTKDKYYDKFISLSLEMTLSVNEYEKLNINFIPEYIYKIDQGEKI